MRTPSHPAGVAERDHDVEHRSPLLIWFAAATLVALLVGRVAAPALRGWTAGIAQLIAWSDVAASFTAQLQAVLGVLLLGRLLLQAFRMESLPAWARVTVIPCGAAVMALLVLASQVPLQTDLQLALACASGLAALAAALVTLRTVETRAIGLLLAVIGGAGLLQALARTLALQASAQALPRLFLVAQGLTTAAVASLGLACVIGLVWLASGRWRGLAIRGATVTLILIPVVWAARMGSLPQASRAQVLAARALQELNRQPRPLLPPWLSDSLYVLPLCLAGVALLTGRPRSLKAAVALILCAGLETDLAPLAASLAVAALVALPRASLSEAGVVSGRS